MNSSRIVAQFSDDGISGTRGRSNRSALDATLKAAVRGEFNELAAWSIDRLGRSLQHLVLPELPFGGVGNSRMGKYHGRWGFEAFTNARGVMYHNTRIDPGVRYPPYAQHPIERKVQARLTP